MTYTFKTTLVLDLLLDRKENYEIDTKKAEITWDLEMDVRSWGIKDLTVTVPEQQIEVELSIWGENGTEDTKETVIMNVKDVTVEGDLNFNLRAAPMALSYYKGKWTLTF